MTLLRQYEGYECGADGYPFAWHGVCGCDKLNLDTDDCVFDEVCMAGEPAIKDLIREEAHHRCERCWHPYKKGMGEWSPCDEKCNHGGKLVEDLRYTGEVWEARARVLTVHHLDEDKANCRWWNLVALCQRCHLLMQRKVVMNRPWHYSHSEWFKPYAAAFYAFKYLGEDLARADVMARMPELLALEYQGTQEALL